MTIPKPPVIEIFETPRQQQPLPGARVRVLPLTVGENLLGAATLVRYTAEGVYEETVISAGLLNCGCIILNPAELGGVCEFVENGQACGALLHQSSRLPPCNAEVQCCGRRVCRQHLGRPGRSGKLYCRSHDRFWRRLFVR